MLKLPDYFSIYALMNEDGAIIVETDTAEEDGSVRNAGIIVAVLSTIFDYCIRRSKGALTRENLLEAMRRRWNDPTLHTEVTDVPTTDELYSDNPNQPAEKKEPDPFEGIKLPKFVM